jgi:hypothetical protein
MFDTILCISLFGVKARWTGIERLASLQDGKKGSMALYYYSYSLFVIFPLFCLSTYLLAAHNRLEWTGLEWAGPRI